ncbi:unnamed protein product [Camellia sinensis]
MAHQILNIFLVSLVWASAIICIISGTAFILIFSSCLLSLLCRRRRTETMTLPSSIGMVSETQLIVLPSYNYTKDNIDLVSKTHDKTCAVCLSEFLDGEQIRVLPDCLHPFHVPCIDMWLYSHSNCPICRTDVTPPAENICLEVAIATG